MTSSWSCICPVILQFHTADRLTIRFVSSQPPTVVHYYLPYPECSPYIFFWCRPYIALMRTHKLFSPSASWFGSRVGNPFPLFFDGTIDTSVFLIEHTCMYIFLLSSKTEN